MVARQIASIILLLLTSIGLTYAQVPVDLQLTDLGISPTTILAMRHAGDGSNRLFLVERSGTIEIYLPGSGITGTFLSIGTDVNTSGEGGLLGLAFHPDYVSNGYFYVYYTRDGPNPNPLETVIERFSVSDADPDVANQNAEDREIIFTLAQPATNHNAGDIHFGPNGFLYVALGDGGASSATAQNADNLLGKMLRIIPCATDSCTVGYTVPGDNPNVGASGPDEIWSSGLRNPYPYRWSFDRDTGDIFIADVGAGLREEVSFQDAASAGEDNYGWNCREGDIAGPGGCNGTFVEPIITYSSANGSGNCAISGGYRYRGCIEGLQGLYVFGDYCSSRIWFGTETSPNTWAISEWTNISGNIFGFGEDEAGELYMSQGGSVYRFDSASSCLTDLLFEHGFEDQ